VGKCRTNSMKKKTQCKTLEVKGLETRQISNEYKPKFELSIQLFLSLSSYCSFWSFSLLTSQALS
jgi:hypothetical protein